MSLVCNGTSKVAVTGLWLAKTKDRVAITDVQRFDLGNHSSHELYVHDIIKIFISVETGRMDTYAERFVRCSRHAVSTVSSKKLP